MNLSRKLLFYPVRHHPQNPHNYLGNADLIGELDEAHGARNAETAVYGLYTVISSTAPTTLHSACRAAGLRTFGATQRFAP